MRMKKILLFLGFWICSTVLPVCAQSETEVSATPTDFQPAFVLKWNPFSLPFGKISMLGEYLFKEKRSFTLAAGIPIEQTTTIEIDQEKRQVHSKTFSAMAGYRLYLGKQSLKGVYFEPYFKYVRNDANLTVNGDLGTTPTEFYLRSKYSGYGVGAQLGLQFLIARRISIDFFFLGPEANLSDYSLVSRDVSSSGPWDAQDAADAEKEIRDVVDDIPLIGKKINVQVDPASKTAKAEYNGFLPGFRAGISFGFRF